ncbi:ABC transporter substrate-binding protein [Cypionkella sp.]|uniref:ABC transporter substrate-binding protein n=1 Tax=Cypionkella sp. TaxID=2811411 RepID=UPI003750AFD1
MTLMKTLATSASLLAMGVSMAAAQSMDDLVAAAKAEGSLTTIALPHDWCGYGAVIEGFKAKYPEITVNELNPDGSSADELEAIRANKGNTGPQAPDVVDIGLSFGPAAKDEGLIQPYKVSTWDSIPDSAKDADGFWYGDYYGVMSFIVNTDLVANVPTDWSDLMKPEYANAFALSGDPRSGNQGLMSVMSAGMAAGGAPGADSAAKGLEFMAGLNKAGNFVPVSGKTGTIAQGATPIVAAWDYNALAWRDTLAGNPKAEVVIPASGVLAGVYVQAISAFAPHPNAAKLWMEYIYSDEGQLGWLNGYCHPIRFNDLAKRDVIPAAMMAKLPPAAAYEKAVFPTLEQQGAHKEGVTAGWEAVVGVKVE